MTPTPLDAWTLARLLAGRPVNGELGAVSATFRQIANDLYGLADDGRQSPWSAFLDSQDDRDEIILALASIDPEGPAPPPHEDDDEADDWGPISYGAMPEAEPFPLDILPCSARHLAEAAARSIGCPVDFPAVACLAAASGVIGRSASLLIKSGYFESASLYLALAGDSSDGKSPSIDAATRPIRDIAARLHAENQETVAAWGSVPEKERGERPKGRRIDTSNPTVEALAPILSHNPRGIIVLPDEFTGWVLSMGQYKAGKGADKQFYLSTWGGSRATIDRVKDAGNPMVVGHPFLTIAGGMTPGRLGALAADGGAEDGFMGRLLFAFPEPVRGRTYSEEGIPQEITDDWRMLIESLWRRPMRDIDSQPAPHVVQMTPEARRAWRERCQGHLDEQERDDFPRSLKGPWGKLQSYAGRLALILHLMDLATDPTRPADDEPPELPRRIIDSAWRLVSYFKSHARRVYAAMRGRNGDGGEDVRALLGWIVRNDKAEFTLRDVDRNFTRFKADPATLPNTLTWMVARNLIRLKAEPEGRKPGPGRKPSPRYEANPVMRNSPRFRLF